MSQLEVAVSGSRTVRDRGYVWAILDYEILEWTLAGYEISLRIGDAMGVDTHAIAWARARRVRHTIYFASGPGFEQYRLGIALLRENGADDYSDCESAIPVSDWATSGSRSGTIRNSSMLTGADILIAIHDGDSPGTRDAMAQARMRSVFIHYWSYPPVAAENSALGYPAEVSA